MLIPCYHYIAVAVGEREERRAGAADKANETVNFTAAPEHRKAKTYHGYD